MEVIEWHVLGSFSGLYGFAGADYDTRPIITEMIEKPKYPYPRSLVMNALGIVEPQSIPWHHCDVFNSDPGDRCPCEEFVPSLC